MDKFIAATRTDGLGVRLMALLNAMALSKYLKCEFKFSWDDNKSKNPYHDVISSSLTFNESFISSHYIESKSISNLTKVDLESFLKSEEKDIYFYCPQSLSGDLRNNKDVFGFMKSFNYSKVFDEIGFSSEINKAICAAREVELGFGAIALHLRAGDVIYAGFRRSGYYVNKIISWPLALDIIKKHSDKRIVIFSQDHSMVEFLKSRFTNLVFSLDMADVSYDGVQRAIFDIVLMSRCGSIIAGSSGFSMCAAMLSGTKVTKPSLLYNKNEMLTVLEKNVRVPAHGINSFQHAYAILTYLTIGYDVIKPDEYFCLAKEAYEIDKDNLFYIFLQIHALIKSNEFENARRVFDNLNDKDLDKFFEVLRLNFARAPLNKYTDAQGFFANFEHAADSDCLVSIFICFLVCHFQNFNDQARLYLNKIKDMQELSFLNRGKLNLVVSQYIN